MKILIADDEKKFINLMQEWLKVRGYTVETAYDGREAFDLMKRENYDIAFLDFNMPELTALEVIKNLKQLGVKAKVVVISGYPEITASFAKLSGADEFIFKPVRFEIIEKIIENFRASSPLT